eukprot:2804301-Ditylum_brightwellii.AAC.1
MASSWALMMSLSLASDMSSSWSPMEATRSSCQDDQLKLGINDGIKLGHNNGTKLGIKDGMELGLDDGMELGIINCMELGCCDGNNLDIKDGMQLGSDGEELSYALKMAWGWLQMA